MKKLLFILFLFSFFNQYSQDVKLIDVNYESNGICKKSFKVQVIVKQSKVKKIKVYLAPINKRKDKPKKERIGVSLVRTNANGDRVYETRNIDIKSRPYNYYQIRVKASRTRGFLFDRRIVWRKEIELNKCKLANYKNYIIEEYNEIPCRGQKGVDASMNLLNNNELQIGKIYNFKKTPLRLKYFRVVRKNNMAARYADYTYDSTGGFQGPSDEIVCNFPNSLSIRNLKLISTGLVRGSTIRLNFELKGNYNQRVSIKVYEDSGSQGNLVASGFVNPDNNIIHNSNWTTIEWSDLVDKQSVDPSKPLFLVVEYKGIKKVISNYYRTYRMKDHGDTRDKAIVSLCSNQNGQVLTSVVRRKEPLEIGGLYTFIVKFQNITYRNYREVVSGPIAASSIEALTRNTVSVSKISYECPNNYDLELKESDIFVTSNCFSCPSQLNILNPRFFGGTFPVNKHIIEFTQGGGGFLNAQFTVTNTGDRPSEPVKVNFYLSRGYNSTQGIKAVDQTLTIGRLEPRGQYTANPTFSYDDFKAAAGNYYLVIHIEPGSNDNNSRNNLINIPVVLKSINRISGRLTKAVPTIHNQEMYPIRVYSFSGVLLSKQNVNNKSEEKEILRGLPKGLYIIKIGKETYKISK